MRMYKTNIYMYKNNNVSYCINVFVVDSKICNSSRYELKINSRIEHNIFIRFKFSFRNIYIYINFCIISTKACFLYRSKLMSRL